LQNLQILVIENPLWVDETSSPFTLFIKSTQSCSKGKKKLFAIYDLRLPIEKTSQQIEGLNIAT